jgi:uncharacterized protein YjiS (DUF1127 family)
MATMITPLHAPLWLMASREARALGRDLLARWRRRRLARATRRALGAVDDRLLRDLGLDRSQIASVAAHPDDADGRRRPGRLC